MLLRLQRFKSQIILKNANNFVYNNTQKSERQYRYTQKRCHKKSSAL